MSKATRATQVMEKSGKPYDLLEYDYDPDAASIGLQAAQAMGLPPAQVFKTLMVQAGTEVCLAVLPSDRELSMKALAAAAGQKHAAMVKPADAERLSGYKIGGISPLGQKKRLRTFLDASAQTLPFLVINGGQRGLQIKLAPNDLIAVAQAAYAAIATAGSP
ncbi:Cys-tRNA(Pro)/Cys-tRNA(Cys) deacylase YbaK [mine drainage metagenome]|uniref:Cys-tRNA(Pro)/Cys-tRNA(Cys) deacylase YbaK n=1 Tax=mine drainage metagenome TaxID=410659 RepID=A0A1J5R4L6_9ZZZZ